MLVTPEQSYYAAVMRELVREAVSASARNQPVLADRFMDRALKLRKRVYPGKLVKL
jgi:hypothetical protein